MGNILHNQCTDKNCASHWSLCGSCERNQSTRCSTINSTILYIWILAYPAIRCIISSCSTSSFVKCAMVGLGAGPYWTLDLTCGLGLRPFTLKDNSVSDVLSVLSYGSRPLVQCDHSVHVLVPWYVHMDPNHIYSFMGTFYGLCNGMFLRDLGVGVLVSFLILVSKHHSV